jgi:predicted ATPase/class 3 adenylate cyclase
MARPRPDLPTGTVTFLFSDIEGSTRLAQKLDPATFGDLIEQHHRLLRAAFAAHAGVERGTEGDSFLVIFRTAPDAIAAAIDGQRSLAAAPWPDDLAVRVRMGLHSGAAIAGGDDYVGLDINRAARIASAGHGGQILISDSTRALTEHDLPAGASVRDLGRHRLKDLVQPEHLFQLVAEGLPAQFPAPRTLEGSVGNLPTRLTSFVGRDEERRALAALLAMRRLVTITGPGGTGKTSLALAVAGDVAGNYPDGAWFVPLEAVADADLVPAAVVRALRLDVEDRRTPEQRLIDYVSDRRVLLVLDNFEHLPAGASFVSHLLDAATQVSVLVASQVPLHIGGEQEYPLAPLPVPTPSAAVGIEIDELRSNPSVRLFLDRAMSVRPEFELDASSARAVVDICDRLNGLPLAIELAAAQMRMLSPAMIRDRLATRIDLLASRRSDLPDRQRTLAGAVAWSYELLPQPERALLRRLSVFAGSAAFEQIEDLIADAAGVGDAMSALEGLVDRSLVQPRREAEDRYALLETIRVFAASRLREEGAEAAAFRRHAELYAELAEQAEPELYRSSRRAWIVKLTTEHDNFRTALDRMEAAGEVELGLRLAAALWRFWQLTGYLAEAKPRLDRLLALAPASPDRIPATLLSRAEEAAGGIGYWQRMGDPATVEQHYARSLEHAITAGDPRRVAWATYNLSFVYDYIPASIAGARPDRARATALRAEALQAFRLMGDRVGIGYCLWSMGGSPSAIAEEPEVLRDYVTEALAMFRETDEAYGETWALMSLAILEAVTDHPNEALEAILAAAALFTRDGDVAGQVVIVDGLAALAARRGDARSTARIDAAGQAMRRRTGAMVPPIPPLREPIAAARESLDQATLDSEQAAGAALSFEEILEAAAMNSTASPRALEDSAASASSAASPDSS